MRCGEAVTVSNTSATGGYLVAASSSGFPGGLTLNQFLQTVLVGISGLPASLVRPKWQIAPPASPDLAVNWLAFGVSFEDPDTFAYLGLDNAGTHQTLIRQENVTLQCAFYGPDCDNIARLVRNGFQLPQNNEALRAGNMGFVSSDRPMHVPDLVNERFIDRIEMGIFLRRQVQDTYPVLNILSASGEIHTVLGDDEYLLDWQTPEGS